MQHKRFHSKFKRSVGRSALLDIIKDSPFGESPHRAVAMGLIFERTVHDCRERMLVQAKKSSQADPGIRSHDCRETTSTLTIAVDTTATHPTTMRPAATQPPPPETRPMPTAVQPVQERASRTEPYPFAKARMQQPEPPLTSKSTLLALARSPAPQTATGTLDKIAWLLQHEAPAKVTSFPKRHDPYRK